MRGTRVVTLLGLGLVTFALGASRNAGEGAFTSNGVKIAYSVEGEGDPVILIHGFCANAMMQWKAPGVVRELAKSYRVIALDNRGHGSSEKPHDPAQYGEEMVRDVVRLMDELKIEKAHIVGYSMGAYITGKLMSQYPERVRSATLGGAGWMDPEIQLNVDGLAEALAKERSLGPLIEFLTPEGQPKPSAEQIRQINSLLLSFNDPLALAAVAKAMPHLAVPAEKWKANRVPTLVLMGDLDPLKVGVAPLQKVKPRVEVHWLKGATHMDAFQKPEFVKKLVEFLRDVEAEEKGLKKAG